MDLLFYSNSVDYSDDFLLAVGLAGSHELRSSACGTAWLQEGIQTHPAVQNRIVWVDNKRFSRLSKSVCAQQSLLQSITLP